MAHIVAIGGGSMKDLVTLTIDKYIVKLTGKKKPHVLLIPTATYDDPERYEVIKEVYGSKLGCSTDVLYLIKKAPLSKEIKTKLQAADIIYVSGGNTLKLMRRWRKLGLDKMLKEIWKRSDKVLCGSSAGALCWFEYGHSDSMFYYHPHNWDYVRVKCLGFIPAMLCPHYLKEKRDESYKRMVKKYGGKGVALDDAAAFHITGDKYKVISGQPGAYGYKLRVEDGVMNESVLKNEQFRSLDELIK